MSTYGYLAHHGVKGQKWGVRKQYERKGRQAKQVPHTVSPDKRKKMALIALAAIAGTAVVGGGIALGANRDKVGKAVTSIGHAVAKGASKAGGQKILSKGNAVVKNKLTNKSAKESAKVMKAHFRKEGRKAFGKALKDTAKNVPSGVFSGLKGAAKDFSSKENVEKLVKDATKDGVKVAVGAAISGGIALTAKTAISGRKPSREEAANYLTKNPNKKK